MATTPGAAQGQKLGEIYVDILTRLDKFDKSLDKIERDAEKRGDEIGKKIDKGITTQFKRMQTRVLAIWGSMIAGFAAFQSAISLAVEAKNVARDADEIQSKFDVVFGNMRESANRWAEEFGSAVGRANQDVKRWLSTLQDTFVPLGFARREARQMSQDLVQLAVDVASFNNAADDETIELFTSALVGNHEAVRRFGIVITEATLKQEALRLGITKQFNTLTDLEKVQLRYSIILKSTADAQGDAVRTADSLANVEKRRDAVLKNLLETQGQKLVPFFKEFTLAQINLLDAVRKMTQGVQDQVKEFEALKTNLSSQETEIRTLQARYNELTGQQSLSAEEQEELNKVIERLAFLVPGAVTAVDNYGKALGISTAAVDRFLDKQRALLQATQADVFEDLQVNVRIAAQRFLAAQQGIAALNDELDEVERNGGRVVETWEELGATSVRLQRIQQDTATAQAEIDKQLEETTENSRRYSEELQALLPLLENFIDIENATPESLSKELGLSAEQAEILASRLPKVVEEINNLKNAQGDDGGGGVKIPLPPAPERPKIEVEFSTDESELEFIEANDRMFSELRFRADDYLAYRLAQIDLELDEFRRAGVDSVEIQKLKTERLKALEAEYTEFLKGEREEQFTDAQRVLQAISEEQQANFDFVRAGYETMSEAFNDAFSFIEIKASSTASAFERGVIDMANIFIAQVKRMIAQWLAFQAIKTAASFFGVPLPFGAEGGNFVGTAQGVRRAATGADFIVPHGFNNDSFPLLVQSGERVRVDAATATNMSDQRLNQVVQRLDAILLNAVESDGGSEMRLEVAGQVETRGADIVTVYDDTKAQQNRFR